MRAAAEPSQCSPGILSRRVPGWSLPTGRHLSDQLCVLANGTLDALHPQPFHIEAGTSRIFAHQLLNSGPKRVYYVQE